MHITTNVFQIWILLMTIQHYVIKIVYVTNDHGYVPLVVITCRSSSHSWLITGFVTRLTRLVSLVEQELPTLPQHLSSPPAFSGVRVRGDMCVFVDRCLSFCTFSFWPLYCLFFFDIRIMVTPLFYVANNISQLMAKCCSWATASFL